MTPRKPVALCRSAAARRAAAGQAAAIHTSLLVSTALAFSTFLLAIAPTASATATDTHYWVINDPTCNSGPRWDLDECWSHSSGGPNDALVPTITNDVIIDSDPSFNVPQADAFAKSVLMQNVDSMFMSMQSTDFTVAGDVASEGASTEILFYLGESAPVTFSYGGTITNSASGTLRFIAATPGNAFIQYTGPNDYGTAGGVSFGHVEAVGPTIYCYPTCVDEGGNTNIVFGPAPQPPVGGGGSPAVNAVRALTFLTVLLIGPLLSLLVLAWLLDTVKRKFSKPPRLDR